MHNFHYLGFFGVENIERRKKHVWDKFYTNVFVQRRVLLKSRRTEVLSLVSESEILMHSKTCKGNNGLDCTKMRIAKAKSPSYDFH